MRERPRGRGVGEGEAQGERGVRYAASTCGGREGAGRGSSGPR